MHGGTPLLVTTYNLLFIYSFLYNCIIDKHITKWPISIPLFPHLFEVKKRPPPKQQSFILELSFRFNRNDADDAAILTPSFKSDFTVNLCENGVILTHPNVFPHMETGTTLTDDDGASRYKLTIMSFRAQTLSVGVTTVVSGTRTFFMSV